ncbi:MAG: carboxynorspermidine decarboxylase [Saprospiraceae bacterium]|nr:carboxynorspermidine decarboxylase [Saprospiraceae bacterium]
MDFSTIKSPAYILDEKLLRRNLELMERVRLEADVQIIVAFKGFSMWSAFPMVRQYLDGATASSLYEAKLCFSEMKTLAHTYAAVYFPEDFERILKYSSHISFNSLSQFQRFYPQIQRFTRHEISCGLRVNPEFSVVETDLYNPGKAGGRLGEAIDNIKNGLPQGIEGLHVHALCESTATDTEGLLLAIEEKMGHFLPQLKWLNIGGGHLMTKAGYDIEYLIQALKAFKSRHPHLDLILEPGSAVGWDTGVLLSEVLDIVDNHGVKTVMVDVSFTAHMPDTLEMPYRPRIRNAGDFDAEKFNYKIGGTSCLSGDYMDYYSFDKELKVGDVMVFEDMIHYTMVKTTMFNGVKHPDIGIWTEKNEYQLVRRFNYTDFKRRLS